jgi:hypothetical protein
MDLTDEQWTVLEALAADLEEQGGFDLSECFLSECFIDGSFIVAKKGRMCGKNQAGQRYEAHGSGRPR